MKLRNYRWASGVQIRRLQQNQLLLLGNEPTESGGKVSMPMNPLTEGQ